jgi:hypothetical protein
MANSRRPARSKVLARKIAKQRRKPVRVKRPRKSLARRRVNPHMTGAVKLSDNVEAVLYRHAHSATRAPYKHKFGKGVSLYGLRDGSVIIKGPKRLWEMFTVEDSE